MADFRWIEMNGDGRLSWHAVLPGCPGDPHAPLPGYCRCGRTDLPVGKPLGTVTAVDVERGTVTIGRTAATEDVDPPGTDYCSDCGARILPDDFHGVVPFVGYDANGSPVEE